VRVLQQVVLDGAALIEIGRTNSIG